MLPKFNSVFELLKMFATQEDCIKFLESIIWPDGKVVSPFDKTSKVYACKNNKYHCVNTDKYFSVTTFTLFHNTKIKLPKWFLAIYLINQHRKGISSVQLAKDLGVTQKTAWYMEHRIRNCYGCSALKAEMKSNVQMDETFVGGKNKNRHKAKKIKNSQGRSHKDKTPIFGMLSEGKVYLKVVPDTSPAAIQPIIFNTLNQGTTIITDEWSAYAGLEGYYEKHQVYHCRGQYMTDCGFSTNGIEGVWSILKRGVIGIYHSASRKHLQRYADEFAFRHNTRDKTAGDTLVIFAASIQNTAIPYKRLIA